MEYKDVIATVETWINLDSLLNCYDIRQIGEFGSRKIHWCEGTYEKSLLHGIRQK